MVLSKVRERGVVLEEERFWNNETLAQGRNICKE
jgi:hypothetical protein